MTEDLFLKQMSVPVLSALGAAIAQFLFGFGRPQVSIVKTLAFGFVVGFFIYLVLERASLAAAPVPAIEAAALACENFLIFFSVFYCFFHFVHISEASVRIRILREIRRKGAASVEDILACYDARSILEARLDRLLKSGQIVLRDGRYFSGKSRILYIALTFEAMKKLIMGAQTK